MIKLIIESVSDVNEKAGIHGIALVPRISRNGNLYTKSEMEKADGVTVPLNWEHDSSKIIGSVTFSYNPALEQLFYEGTVTDERYAVLVKNKKLFTSIEADVEEVRDICNGPKDCFKMPIGLHWRALALTEMPGVPETSVMIAESFIGLPPHVCKEHADTSLSTKSVKSNLMSTKEQEECPAGQDFVDGKCVPKKTEEASDTAGVDQEKPSEVPCPEGSKVVDGKCTPADNSDNGSPVSTGPKETAKEDCGCSGTKEAAKTWIPNADEISKNQKELKEMISDVKARINTLDQVDELKRMEAFNKNLYKVTKLGSTGSGVNSFAQEDLKYVAQEGLSQLKKFGNYSFDIDLSEQWVREQLAPRNSVQEAISFSGDQSNKVAAMSDVYVLPGGKYLKSIRDLVRFQEIPNGTDQIKFFKGGIPNQGTITEGSVTSASTHTISTVTLAADTVTGVAQSIKAADVEDSPFPIFDYIAQTARAEVLEHEATLVFDTASNAATPGLWINAATAGTISSDDVASMTMDHTAIATGLQYYEEQGYDTSFGNIAMVCHPKALRELRTSSNLVRLVQEGDANITKTGRLTHLYGVEIIPSTAVKAQNNSTNDTYRNSMIVKGHTFALGSKRDLTIDMRKIPRESAFDWAWSQRKNATVFDASSLVRISSAQ
jgi:hypothetical protein